MRAIVGFVLLSAVTLTGCSQAMRLPMPEAKGPLAVKVSTERPSKANDMPPGIHQIPETSVYIAGYQGEAMKVGMHFGLIGMLAADAAAKSTSEKKAEGARTQLQLDMRAATERALAEQLRRADAGRVVGAAAARDGVLEVVPYLVISSTGSDQVRPWVFLKTTLKDGAGEEKWKTRYIVSLGQPRALAGPNGWASGDGTALRAAVDNGLRTGLALMLRDASGALPRTPARAVKVRTQWPWVKESLDLAADVLEETSDKLVVLPKVGDVSTFAGINVLDKSAVTVSADEK
jgi:hypothetical protein